MKSERLEFHKPTLKSRIFDPDALRDTVVLFLLLLALCFQSVSRSGMVQSINLTAFFLMYFAVARPFTRGLVLTLVAGYLADLFGGETRGLVMGASVFAYVFVRVVVVRFLTPQWFVVSGVAFLASVADLSFRFLFAAAMGAESSVDGQAFGMVLRTGLGALVFAYPLYRGLMVLDQRLQGRVRMRELRT